MGGEERKALVTELVTSQGRRLRHFLVSRVRNRADIPDVMQEVFLRLMRVPNHETIRAPEAYLFTVAHHVAMQMSLRDAARPVSMELGDVLGELQAVPEADPAQQISAQQSLEVLQRALEQLPPKARAAFLLHRRDGLSVEEIGERLNISRPMTKKYLVKALVHFRQALAEAEQG